MSCGYRSYSCQSYSDQSSHQRRRDQHSWILFTLLGVAACTPIALLPNFLQSRSVPAIASTLPAEEVNTSEAAIASVNSDRPLCHSNYPMSCIYANREWIGQLEQGFESINASPEQQQGLEEDEEIVDSSRRSTSSADLGRKIKWLMQLKTWLDAFS